jgi:hypothetical protein
MFGSDLFFFPNTNNKFDMSIPLTLTSSTLNMQWLRGLVWSDSMQNHYFMVVNSRPFCVRFFPADPTSSHSMDKLYSRNK